VGVNEPLQRGTGIGKAGGAVHRPIDATLVIAPLQPVNAGHGRQGAVQQPVKTGQVATGHDGHRAIEPLHQLLQEPGQMIRHPHRVRVLGDFHQGAVEIQKKRPVRSRCRQLG